MLNITRFSTYCVKCDYYSEFIPGISTVTNLIDLFLKYVASPFLSETTLEKSHYLNYLEINKPFKRCAILLIPVLGNIIIGIQIYLRSKEIKKLETQAEASTNESEISDLYKQAAQIGSPQAQYIYGTRLLKGQGFTMVQPARAKKWFRMAAILGHIGAQEALASRKTLSLIMQVTTFSTWCVKGDYYADCIPGISTITNLIDLFLKYVVRPCLSQAKLEKSHYFNYLGSKKTARCFFVLIPVLGNVIVAWVEFRMAKKAREYENRASQASDEKTAAKYYKKAAENGNAEAQYQYGKLRLAGRGVARNQNSAKYWLHIAAIWGHAQAGEALASL